MSEKTTIQVSNQTWKRLNEQRNPGESFDDIINSMLEGGNNA